jgi:hypothetical protein
MTIFFKAIAGLAGIVPGWIWAAICAALVATSCNTGHQRDKARLQLAEIQAATAQQETTRQETARLAEAGHRQRERDHARAVTHLTQKATDEKRRLDLVVADLRRSLQQRPERPTGAPGDPVPGGASGAVACTGAQLYRADAALLVGESERADGLRIQLADCRARYDAAVGLTAPGGKPPVD